jgi:hypothetical protein
MANTLKFGNGQLATKVGSTLAYNDEGGNFKPLPFNFTRSTGGTRVNKDGLIEVVTNNKPRIDFLNDSNGALLLEPSKINNLQRSEEFENAYWVNNGVTITANQIISPSGLLNADLLTGVSGGFGIVRFSTWTATNKVASCFAKAGATNIFKIANVSAGNRYVLFDLSNGTVFEQSAGWTGFIENYGNGWYRCTAISNNETGTFSLGVTASSESVYIWGAQLEAGSYATSYIPTQGAISTRVAETCNQTPPSWIIGQTEGVIYAEFLADGINQNRGILYATQSGSLDERIALQYNAIGQVQAIASSGGITQGNVSFTITGRCKAAIAYNSTNYELFINGVSRGTFSGLLPSGLARLDVGNAPSPIDTIGGFISSVLIYNTRLSNTELQQLTTL